MCELYPPQQFEHTVYHWIEKGKENTTFFTWWAPGDIDYDVAFKHRLTNDELDILFCKDIMPEDY
jgi:hypothetical protein